MGYRLETIYNWASLIGIFFFTWCPHNNENQIWGGNYAVEIELKLGEVKYDESHWQAVGVNFAQTKAIFLVLLTKGTVKPFKQ